MTSASINRHIAGLKQSLDPRAKRIRDILERKHHASTNMTASSSSSSSFRVESFDVFQQPPQTAWDQYMASLRTSKLRQVSIQTNEDARSIETQSYMAMTRDMGMQAPDDFSSDSRGASR